MRFVNIRRRRERFHALRSRGALEEPARRAKEGVGVDRLGHMLRMRRAAPLTKIRFAEFLTFMPKIQSPP